MKKVTSILITLTFVVSLFYIAVPANSSSETALPDYEPVDITSGLAGEVFMPEITESVTQYQATSQELMGSAGTYQTVADFESTPPVGTKVWDWYLYASTGNPNLTLRVVSGNVEVWTQDDMSFLPDDPRNDDPYNLMITQEMLEYLAEEFNEVIYPTDTQYFGTPFDRDGTNTIFELIGFSQERWDWIATDNSQRVILKVLNIIDTNYFEPDYPYYVVGFFSPTYTDYYQRNMIHIDAWRWWQRLGPEGHQWFPEERPDLVVNRPYVYESTTAHEFQHNIHNDWQPYDDLFMNEGCSMFAEILCGYPMPWDQINSFLYTPDNSLTIWGDQGDINILADYGQALLWTVYLSDQYGGADYISYFMEAGIPGIEGINAALLAFGFEDTFDDAFHNWRIANLIHSDFPGNGKYNYKTIDLSEADPVNVLEVKTPVIGMKGTDFGSTETILGYDTGIEEIFQYGTDYIKIDKWKKFGYVIFDGNNEAYYGWRLTDEGVWYSGRYDLMNTLITGSAYVDPTDPVLELETYYDIEIYWDFGFVQISTDSGTTWTSLQNDYTTDVHDPNAHPDIIDNLPGLTGFSGDWITMEFDLSAYAGQDVLIGFRYITDWATYEEGWYISEASVNGAPLELTTTEEYPDVDYQVTLVYTYKIGRHLIHIPWDMFLYDVEKIGFNFLLFKPSYVTLVVSPIMTQGDADYSFTAVTWSPWHWCHHKPLKFCC